MPMPPMPPTSGGPIQDMIARFRSQFQGPQPLQNAAPPAMAPFFSAPSPAALARNAQNMQRAMAAKQATMGGPRNIPSMMAPQPNAGPAPTPNAPMAPDRSKPTGY